MHTFWWSLLPMEFLTNIQWIHSAMGLERGWGGGGGGGGHNVASQGFKKG